MCSISVDVAEGAMSLAQIDRFRGEDEKGCSRRGVEEWLNSGGLARADARVLHGTKEVAACNNSRSLEEGMAGNESL